MTKARKIGKYFKYNILYLFIKMILSEVLHHDSTSGSQREKSLILRRPIDLSPHKPVAQKIANQR